MKSLNKTITGAVFVVTSALLAAPLGCESGSDDTTGSGAAGGAGGASGSAGLDSGSPDGKDVSIGGAGGTTGDASVETGTGGSGGTGPDGAGGTAGTADGSAGAGGTGTCRPAGMACNSNSDCCTVSCDNASKICTVPGQCKSAGGSCTIPQDCCTFVCDNGVCGSSQCTSDNQACTSSSQCCSGNCGSGGVCVPLNPGCRTTNNACTTGADCCSKLCSGGLCSGGSFCTQNGDVCASDFECCGGFCNKAQGATVGLCNQPNPPGGTGCTVAGQACGATSTNDGGNGTTGDGGIPSCGGDCCSRSCAPYRTGLFICQPPSGCRPTGEICRSDADCCGFGGDKGTTGTGNCSKTNATDPVGRCDNGNACRPAGAICKLATTSCNAENNCCSGNVNQNPFVCQQDILGIPRCTMSGTQCTDAGIKMGQACATSADCCGLPCVPNPSFTPDGGVPPFVCGGICVGNGGACSTAADCCPGLPCTAPPGSTRGICGRPPVGDAGIPDATPPGDDATPPGDDASPPGDDAMPPPGDDASIMDVDIPETSSDSGPPCADYGQVCTSNGDCCNGVPCNNGRCVYIIK